MCEICKQNKKEFNHNSESFGAWAWASFDALGPLRHKKFLQPPPHSIF